MQPRCQATLTQPFQCDLQPQLQETHRTTHTGTTTCCKTYRSNHNDRSRTRCTHEVPFIAGCSHFTQKITRFRAPASSPKQPMQLSCSHSIAICTRCKTHRRNHNDRSRTRRTHEVPFIAGCSHFTRKITRFRAPASSPKHSPCNIHAAIRMRSATIASRNA